MERREIKLHNPIRVEHGTKGLSERESESMYVLDLEDKYSPVHLGGKLWNLINRTSFDSSRHSFAT